MERHCKQVERPRTVHLIASLGGHLELLEEFLPALGGLRRVWITSAGVRAERLRRRGERVLTVPRLDRSSPSVNGTLVGARLAVRERPELILSSGAGLAIPFCVVGRALGARILFTETMARVHQPSLSGRAASLLGAEMFIQWPELMARYPRATLCRPAMFETLAPVVNGGTGTFVTLGSHDQTFTRLLDLVATAARAGVLPRPIVVQDGTRLHADDWVDEHHPYVTPDDFGDRVARAKVVVTHGGAGAMTSVLRSGRRPIVVPRLKRWSEHVDDHQLELVDKLNQLGLIVRGEHGIDDAAVQSAARLPRALATVGEGEPLVEAVASALGNGKSPGSKRRGFRRPVRA